LAFGGEVFVKRHLLLAMLLLLAPPALAVLLLLAPPALAILNETGNGNTTAPPAGDDPGWLNLGSIGGPNAVYLGYGWVITAAHVGTGIADIVRLDGVNYDIMLPTYQLIAHDASFDADLAVMKLDPYPEHLPLLEIRPPLPAVAIGDKVTMIGRGRDQGAMSSWGPGGWEWITPGTLRWGTNLLGGVVPGAGPIPRAVVEATSGGYVSQTLVTEFTAPPTPDSPHEGQIAVGDSGAGLFMETSEGSGVWELAGIFILRTEETGQPANTSIYGNDSLAVDLGFYRAQILAITRPCADGVDNDGDTVADFGADADCTWAGDDSELPQCSDGIDNDFDGDTDFGADADCLSASHRFEEPDQDGDFVTDDEDNCLTVQNFDQRDTNLDGYGNACDPDHSGPDANGDGVVGTPDFIQLFYAWGSSVGEPNYEENVDLVGVGVIGTPDFLPMSSLWGLPPGPSGLACAGTIPCQ
jgi:hypothetical protein